MISILLNFLKFVLWSGIWSILVTVPRALEKNVMLLGGVFYIYNNHIFIYYLFSSSMPLLSFCLVVLSIADSGVLEPPNIILDLSVSPLSSVSFYLIFKKCVCVHVCVYVYRIRIMSF